MGGENDNMQIQHDAKMNKRIANAIERWGMKNSLLTDSRIYFNGIAYCYNSNGEKRIIEGIEAEDYFKYGDNRLVSMSFEGGLCDVMREHWCVPAYEVLWNELWNLLSDFGYYFEMGNHWNLTVYPV